MGNFTTTYSIIRRKYVDNRWRVDGSILSVSAVLLFFNKNRLVPFGIVFANIHFIRILVTNFAFWSLIRSTKIWSPVSGMWWPILVKTQIYFIITDVQKNVIKSCENKNQIPLIIGGIFTCNGIIDCSYIFEPILSNTHYLARFNASSLC